MLNRTSKWRLPGLLLTCVFLLASFHLNAQTEPRAVLPDNVPGLLVKANEAWAAKDYLTFRNAMVELKVRRPYNSEYMYQLVIAHALLDEKREAYSIMLGMQQQGLAYDFTKTPGSLNIRGTEVFDYVNDLMKMAAEPLGESEAVFTLPGSLVMPEAIGWDPSRQKFLIGSVATGSIVAVGNDGQVSDLLEANDSNGLWSVFDVLVDSTHNRLWVSSAASPRFTGFDPADKGRSALLEFKLDSLELIHRYPVPVDGSPHSLGNMVLRPNGDILIVDRALPIIYGKRAGEQKLKALLASREMVSMRGIAIRPDGNIIYVADRELGILVVDLEGGRAGKLAVPETLNIGGIDGLYLWNNHLIIIQNGIKPQRVMRLQLDASGTRVEAVRPLAVAQPEFDYPSYGTIVGEDFYFFASNQWGKNKEELKPVVVLRTPLNSSNDLEQPDMQEYLRKRGEAMKARQEKSEKNDKLPNPDISPGRTMK